MVNSDYTGNLIIHTPYYEWRLSYTRAAIPIAAARRPLPEPYIGAAAPVDFADSDDLEDADVVVVANVA
jgi:hypothetical protein